MRLRKETVSLWTADLLLICLGWWAAFWLRFNFDIPEEFETLALQSMPWALVGSSAGLVIARVDRQIWKYIGLPELRQLVLGVFLGGLLAAAAVLMIRYPNFPRSVLLLHPLVALILLGGARAAWRTFVEHGSPSDESRALLIVGSLHDAADALRAIKGSRQWHCVGIASSVESEQGRYLHQIPVLGFPAAIAEIAQEGRPQ